MSETITSTRRGFLDFSPVRRDEDKENDIPILSLIQFSKAPFLTFGTVKLGTSKSAVLQIDNPSEDVEAEVTVDKIPSSKGFCVDHSRFTVQPEGSFSLTVTWTPTEEGGIRELLVFSANGVLKHQAVMLGRAEAPKKKKKSLWDSIKNKREGGKVAAPRRKMSDQPLKMAANKTFQVSRRPQYKREKPRSPLASLNEGKPVRERSLSKRSPINDYPQKLEGQKAMNSTQSLQMLALSDQENIFHVQRNSSLNLPIPAEKLMGCSSLCVSPEALMGKPENKDLARMLNKTLSPIGTPERFKKLMPNIYSDSPLSATVTSGDGTNDADNGLTGTPVPSLKDALALIDSDLSHINSSPQDTSSSCGFSDSLESKSGGRSCEPHRDFVKASSDGPQGSGDQQLTFFIGKNDVSEVVVSEPDKVAGRVKKSSFTSVTVTKGKAPIEENSSSGRKIKKSRRRLLEKTLELSDGSSQCESGAGSPSLPVIDLDTGIKEWQKCKSDGFSLAPQLQDSHAAITFPVMSPPSMAPARFSFSVSSPPPAVNAPIAFAVTSPPPLGSSSPLHLSLTSNPSVCELSPTVSAASSTQEELFPIHMVVKGKKRKSEEFMKSDEKIQDAGKTEHVKRSRGISGKVKPSRSLQERRSASQRQQTRTAGSVRSMTTSTLKTARSVVSTQTEQSSSKLNSRGPRSLKSSSSSSVKTAKVVAVAQSKLTFVKPMQTAIPRHPMPFAAKNMFYDERWIEKQERGFTWWINYVLTPDDFKVNTEVAKVNAVSIAMGSDDKFSVPKAPTKEEMSLSTYTARRKLNRLRRSACQLFTSEAMVKAIQRLELEVEAKRLLVRKDRHLWKDIGERRKVLNWLLSYNPLWLRIGLETIFGELISLESNNDTLGLAMFILQRLLWNPDIAAEFRHAKVPHLYKDGHEEALSRFTLKKLLLLVCFLDRAKESRLIEHNPCLFCLDAEFKTTKDLLLAFSRDFLSGEGILPRHLGYLGLPVSHVQTPLDEFNFAVKSLAVDLKCGIRLVRVMELLTQDWSLLAKLRLPAISRLQKVHNVDVALQVLRSKGVDLKDEHGSDIDSKDIVDGHREKTLSLLWKIIFAFHVEVILDENQLMEEISFLKRTLKTKRRLASLRADQGLESSPAKTRVPYEYSSTKITLLMDWVRTVCDFYNLKVENFTVAFSDGRVLCYLIHHYHPGLLPDKAVSHSTTQTVECSPRGRLELNCSASDSDNSFDSFPMGTDSPSPEFKELLENEKNNFRLVNTAVSYLGGVPAMINPADMSNTIPNEKVVMSYLSFLGVRLLDLRNETRAARVIQGAWRKYRLQKDLELYKERNAAAVKIQLLVRNFLQKGRAKKQNRAAVVIQSAWRSYAARNRLRLKREAEVQARQHGAAIVIQAQWRMYSALQAYQCLRYHTIVVQAQWRMRRAASAYRRIYWAAAVIQKHWQARALAKREQEYYLTVRAAAVMIQRGFRSWKTQKTEKENHAAKVIQSVFKKWHKVKTAERAAAAVRIQSWYRMQRCVNQYRKTKTSTVLIQAQFRGHAQRRRFQMLKLQHCSAIVIQRAFRGCAVRKQVARMRFAAVIIQHWFRASMERDIQRQLFVRMRCAAITMQAAYRGKVARDSLKIKHKAATVIQAAFRKYAAQRHYVLLRNAAALVQQRYRATVLARKTKREYDALKNAALTIQANWRGRADRKTIEKQHQCATLIKAYYRRHRAQAAYTSKKAAAVVIQCHYRAYLAGKEMKKKYLHMKAACTAIQAGFRGMRVRTELKKKRHAATVIQSTVRMFLCRKEYILSQSAAIIIQSRYRALVVGRAQLNEFRGLKQAATKIQAVYRGFRARQELKKRHNAATAVQAQFRMHRTRMIFLATKCAAIVIQEHYRARMLRDQQQQKYRTLKAAVLVIQAAYRGYKTRRKIANMHHAAAIIQRRFLTIRERKRFLAIKAAALVCQQRYRASALAKKHHLEYTSKRRAVVCLQAAYRGYEARKQLRIQHNAAVMIQSHFRKHLQRTYYKKLLWTAGVVQARYRAKKQIRQEMQLFSAKRGAALVFQAAFRGMKCRHIIKQKQQAASVIQRAYRTHFERKQYLTMKSHIIAIQRRYRATVTAKEQLRQYQQMCKAAVLLQAAFRGQRVRKKVAQWHQAATVIQSAFRRHREEVKFQAIRLSAIIIQRFYRSCTLQRQERERFLEMRHSAIILQAAYRKRQARKELACRHQAATVIQSAFRKHREVVKFQAMRLSAIVIQRFYRSSVLQRQERERFLILRHSTIILQAAFRGHRVRSSIVKMHRAATVIQANFKRYRQQCAFRRQRWAASVLQQRFRAQRHRNAEMQHYQECREAALVLQAAYRGMKSRCIIKQRHQAATVIQRAFKTHCEHKRYLTLKDSVVTIQQRYRATAAAREQMLKYQKMRKMIVLLQAAFRGQRVRTEVAQWHQAATVIQSAFRRRREEVKFQAMRLSAIIIQRYYRSCILQRQERERFFKMRHSAIVLQAAYRGRQARKESARRHQAATVIQSAFRKHREVVKFQAMRLSAIVIQRFYRSSVLQRQERERFLKLRHSTIILQAAFRGHRVRSSIVKMHRAATVIQANFKRYRQQCAFRRQRWAASVLQQRFRAQRHRNVDMQRYHEVRKAVICLQGAFCGMKSRRAIKQKHHAASVIQRAYGAHCERKRYLTFRASVVTIQKKYRATAAAKADRTQYLEMRNAAIIIQAAYRGQQARKEVARWHQAATVIQSAFRRHREEVKFQAMRLSAIAIQRYYRSCILQRWDREKFLRLKQFTVVLQAAYRGWCVRSDISRQIRAAIVIQSHWRSWMHRSNYQRKREAALILQRRVRAMQLGRLERNYYNQTRKATITLQTHCRAWIARRQALEKAKAEKRLRFTSAVFHHLSAIKIQRALRAHWALETAKRQIHSVITIQRWVRAKQQRKRFLDDRCKVVMAQKAARRWLARRHKAACVIQQGVRKFLCLRRHSRVQQGILKAQALWRGHRSRRLNDNPKVVKLRHCLRKVSADIREEDKLCNKTSSALDYLLRYKHFSYILEALKNLETATRLSPECCERLVESGATNVIFTLIRSCNRSVPCMDVITFSIQILLNLSKYHKTIEAVYSVENSVETLLDLLQRYREKAGDKVAEKGGSIFTKACFLLALLLQDKHRAVEVMKLPKVLDRIRSIYRLTARKHKMDAERTVIKQKMNASINGSFFIPATPRKSHPAPKFVPDWVLRKDKLKDIVDPLRAIEMVANTLSIVS